MLIRIISPYFVAGLEYRIGMVDFKKGKETSNFCAPIIHYMKKWNIGKIISYCIKKKWEVEVL